MDALRLNFGSFLPLQENHLGVTMHWRCAGSAPGGPLSSPIRSSTSSQKPTRLDFRSFQPLGRRGLSRAFFSVRRCFGAGWALARARWALSWMVCLGYSAACAAVLGPAGGSAPCVTPAISEFCVWGGAFSSLIRSSKVRPQASRMCRQLDKHYGFRWLAFSILSEAG